jgi:hypothetical protein
VSTSPKLKPAKAAGKLNPLPAVVGAPSETTQKQTEANDQSRATVLHASGNLKKWRVSAKPVQTLDSVIDSVGKLFSEEATDLFFCSTCEVAEQVRSVPNTDKRKHLEICRELFKRGWLSWLEALGELVHGYAEKLARIAMSYPALVSDDPVKWIRLQLNTLLSRHLRQELSVEALAEQATQRRLARREARRNGIASDPAPLESKPGQSHNYSKVGAWFRWVAEDGSDFDRSESGFHAPWLAPAFVNGDDVFARLRERMTSDPPDRLTAAQTEHVIRHVETLFAGRFDHVLQQEEHRARIALASTGKLHLAPTGQPGELPPTPPVRKSIPLMRGLTCVQVKDEMKQFRRMVCEGGRTVKEVREAMPDFFIWKITDSASVPTEDRETLLHPNQWGPGYADLILSKHFGVSKLSIRDYVTAYNQSLKNPQKTPKTDQSLTFTE